MKTEEEINAAIAKILNADEHRMIEKDYCNCLNAMHEAEEVLMDDWQKQKSYLEWLGWDDERRIWHSTARQRAEAFLRTLGKWEE